jgi:hypothetical protein
LLLASAVTAILGVYGRSALVPGGGQGVVLLIVPLPEKLGELSGGCLARVCYG